MMTDGSNRFPHLFSPLTINKMTLRNRISVPPHFTGWMNTDGVPGDDFVAYLAERAKGGVGLVAVGATIVREGDHPGYYQNLNDTFVTQYRKVADAIHPHGAKVIAQFCPRGPDIRYMEFGEPFPRPPVAGILASATDPGVAADWHVSTYTPTDLEEMAECTGAAALRAKAGGMDAVEIHGHEHHMHAQFLSPVANKRTDHYGGSLENRARFLIESVVAMRQAVGNDFVVGVRLLAKDLHPQGWVEEDCVRVIQMLTSQGLIDYVSLTAGVRWMHIGPMYRPDGEFLPIVAKIRSQIDVPVIHAGRITDPFMAESALAEGQLDIVGMVKAHIADPHWVNKVREDRLDDIRYCIRCVECFDVHGAHCIYNPLTGRELEWGELKPAPAPKRVVVVGAGPAGMESALNAAARGHDVTLLEKADRVGGEVWLAGAAPLRAKFNQVAEYYERQAQTGSLKLRLGTEATPEVIAESKPDVVVIATGSRPNRPDIAGAGEMQLLTVHDVLQDKANGLKRVLVLDRDGRAAAFTAADYLSTRGIAVEFVAAMAQVGQELGELDRTGLYEELAKKSVAFRAGFDVVATSQDGVTLREIFTGEEMSDGPYDAVVIAAGSEPVNDLSIALQDLVSEVHVVGSASEARSIMEATVDGSRVGRLV